MWRSISAPDRIIAVGLALSRPAYFGAEPWTGSKTAASMPMLAPGATHDALQLRQHARGFVLVGSHDRQAPTRSPYSENDFEKELDTNSGPGVAANLRTTAPSASMPSPKPW